MRQMSDASVPICLLDLEVGEALGLLVAYVHALDVRCGRALLAESDESFDVAAASFKRRFDGAVAAVRYPTGDAARLGAPPHRVAKEDALDVPVNDHALSAGRPGGRRDAYSSSYASSYPAAWLASRIEKSSSAETPGD